jgi:hypothetical protein
MKYVYKNLFLLVLALVGLHLAFSHNVMTYPKPRKHQNWGYPTDHVPASRIWQSGAPADASNGRNDSTFTCRNRPQEDPATSIEAGKVLKVKYDVWASHPGDCALYVSYDLDPIPDTQKRWVKIHEWRDCGCNGDTVPCAFVPVMGPFTKTVDVTIPSWLPSSNHAIFRYEMYAVHMRFNSEYHPFMLVELYANCADIQIINNDPNVVNTLPTPTYQVMNHLPADPSLYRAQWDIKGPTAFPSNSKAGPANGEPINSSAKPSVPITNNNSGNSNSNVFIPTEYPLPADRGSCPKISRGLTPQQRELILKMHNEFRDRVAEGKQSPLPTAAGLPELVWDVNLTEQAQAFADECPKKASINPTQGENFYLAPNQILNIEEILKGWYSQVKRITIAVANNYIYNFGYERVSQILWANTTKLGKKILFFII